jgi:hypothetical protein
MWLPPSLACDGLLDEVCDPCTQRRDATHDGAQLVQATKFWTNWTVVESGVGP